MEDFEVQLKSIILCEHVIKKYTYFWVYGSQICFTHTCLHTISQKQIPFEQYYWSTCTVACHSPDDDRNMYVNCDCCHNLLSK
jgi:hypothetical protein